MKECTCVNKVYGTLMEKDLHTVLHADKKKSSMYSVHVEFLFTLCISERFSCFMFTKSLLIGFDPDSIHLIKWNNR
jgi:hypothetical protein